MSERIAASISPNVHKRIEPVSSGTGVRASDLLCTVVYGCLTHT